MPERTVRDVMHAGVVACAPDTPLTEVAATMRERVLSALVVMQDGLAVGVISQTDLVNAAFVQPYLHHWRGLAARHLMTSPVVSVRPDARLGEALDLLRACRIHRVIVTEPAAGGERPVGVLSMTDVVRAVGGDDAGRAAGRKP
ncbi:MAG TPA: CBS domain-containing protein [Methylomirabilota bacterium]|nr:CBS domain-containing protein [Methylomirabilota bacterium]